MGTAAFQPPSVLHLTPDSFWTYRDPGAKAREIYYGLRPHCRRLVARARCLSLLLTRPRRLLLFDIESLGHYCRDGVGEADEGRGEVQSLGRKSWECQGSKCAERCTCRCHGEGRCVTMDAVHVQSECELALQADELHIG